MFAGLLYVGVHGQNVEFADLIPVKICFWREIVAILREYLSLRYGYYCLF